MKEQDIEAIIAKVNECQESLKALVEASRNAVDNIGTEGNTDEVAEECIQGAAVFTACNGLVAGSESQIELIKQLIARINGKEGER